MICSICLSIIKNRDLFKSKCNHRFHNVCIDNWLSINKTCPLCRCNIKKISKTRYFIEFMILSLILCIRIYLVFKVVL